MKRLQRFDAGSSHVEPRERLLFDNEVKVSLYAEQHAREMNRLHGEDFGKWLSPLLASFEVRSKGGSIYYLLSDWATGTLKHFWNTNLTLVGDKSWLPWVAKQLSGLVGALRCIHNTSIQDRYQAPYGRHGNIKPWNILYFGSQSGQKSLALSGLHIATLHWKPVFEENPKGITYIVSHNIF